MAEVILFGDIEAALIAYVKAQLVARSDSADVSDTGYKPSSTAPRPDRLVVIKRIGGMRQNLVTDSATIDLHCYDTTYSAAQTLIQLVRGIINALPGTTISGCLIQRVTERVSPAHMQHPKSNNPRYVMTLDIDYRGSTE